MDSSSDTDDPGASRTPGALGLNAALESGGLNAAAVLSPEQYDALVPVAWQCSELLPTAASVFVLGSGGSMFYLAARRARPDAQHPLDEFCEELVTGAASELERQGAASRAVYYWERMGGIEREPGHFADFIALARAAGLGASSRLGLMLNPIFGPWFAIRALILCELPMPVPAAVEAGPLFDPCSACPAPCIEACPGTAVSLDPFSRERCASTREELPGCARRCDARLACPVGASHRYDPEALAYHMTARFRGDDRKGDSRGAQV
jgi:epoxyqueuosine reductase